MKIKCPPGYLVVDESLWSDHMIMSQMPDVVGVIMGFYKSWDGSKYVLNPNCKRMLDSVVASKKLLMGYYYYYPETDPAAEAAWFVEQTKAYPVTYYWADLEAYKAVMTPALRSERNRLFTEALASLVPAGKTGVYAAKWYIDAYAPDMNKWLSKYPAWVSHYGREPSVETAMSWQDMETYWLPNYEIILSSGQLPEKVMGHQFSDRLIVPGSYTDQNVPRALDVSVFKMEFIDVSS